LCGFKALDPGVSTEGTRLMFDGFQLDRVDVAFFGSRGC
jgi:hypothetical protein